MPKAPIELWMSISKNDFALYEIRQSQQVHERTVMIGGRFSHHTAQFGFGTTKLGRFQMQYRWPSSSSWKTGWDVVPHWWVRIA